MNRAHPVVWEQFRRPDGSLNLDAALEPYVPTNVKPHRLRAARDFLADLEDLTPIRRPEAAAIALHGALRLLYP